MKPNLSLGQMFFAPTPLKTFKTIIVLLLLAVITGGLYFITACELAKYISILLLVIAVILQFKVDYVALALDEFDPNDNEVNELINKVDFYSEAPNEDVSSTQKTRDPKTGRFKKKDA